MTAIADESEARAYVASLCDGIAMDRLAKLNDLLIAENASQNLVARATIPIVWQRHIADSAQLLELVQAKHAPWLDLGSGAGFPGLVIAAMRPDLEVILVESRKRRVDWLERAREGLALENCRVAGCRLEDVERFDAGTISARAFAPLDRLLGLAGRFSTKTTDWVLPKGRSGAQEVQGLPKDRRKMFHVEQSRTDPDAGVVVGRGQWSAKP